MDYFDVLHALLALHVCIILGLALHESLEIAGLNLPEFVPCLFVGIIMTNLMPLFFKSMRTKWPTQTPAIALIADISLGTFLAMSLMSLQIWTLLGLAGPIIALLATQFVVAVVVTLFVVFPLMGKTYDAAVVAAGFGGISLGSTPTAMANMSAVTKRYGDSHVAFVIVPLVCAFFIDLANAIAIPRFLSMF